jgi:hypothetical protein
MPQHDGHDGDTEHDQNAVQRGESTNRHRTCPIECQLRRQRLGRFTPTGRTITY